MNLGSPVGSPPRAQNPVFGMSPMTQNQHTTNVGAMNSSLSGTGSGTGFLPGYLMGEYSQQGTGRLVSPTKLNRSISQNVAGTPQTPIGTPSVQNRVNGFLTPTTPASQIQTPGGSLRNATNDKQTAGGPPTSGLYSTPKQRRALHAAASVNTGNNTPKTSLLGTPVNGIQNQSINTPSNQFNTSIDELGNSSCHEGSTWVTIFGFPSSAASYILQQFSQCGTVLQHHIPANGNWMNIRFQTKMQAQSALGRNGRIMGGTLMIGVVPCQGDTNSNSMLNNSNILDQKSSAGRLDNSNVANISSSLGNTTNKSIRPLTQAYKAAQSEHEVSMSSHTPSKNDGLVTRAMEYIFGW